MKLRFRALQLLFFLLALLALAAPAAGGGVNEDDVPEAEFALQARPSVGRTLKQAPSGNNTQSNNNSSLILAKSRTNRRDPLKSFERYRDGWDIRNKHYWGSVGFTGLPGFLLALLWAASGVLLALSLCLYCCCCRRKDRYSHEESSKLLPLTLLFLFSLAAIAGCVLVYYSQAKFNNEISGTLDFVVDQSQATVENLQNVSRTLNDGASINIFNFGLPNEEKQRVQQISQQLNSTSNQLETKTEDNAHRIRRGINAVRLAMNIIAGVMLLLVLLGILFTACGLRSLVYLLVFVGWILVIGTWILCGIYILLNNVMGDTCVAMEEWVQNPNARTNLDDILPCVDEATANQTLLRSKEVTVSTVNVLNRAVTLVLNSNNLPAGSNLNFNQSGPTMPTLCSPYGPAPDYNEVSCSPGTVTLQQAPGNWSGYVCRAQNGRCTSTGRVTPEFYDQISKAVSAATGLTFNVPFLVNVQNCVFVRDTFQTIIRERCPDLRKYTKWIYIGLAIISGGVMASILLWILATRRRYRRHPVGYEKNEPEKLQHPHPA